MLVKQERSLKKLLLEEQIMSRLIVSTSVNGFTLVVKLQAFSNSRLGETV